MEKEAFELRGRIEAVLAASDPDTGVSVRCAKVALLRGHGVQGDRHAGPRLADVREDDLLAFGLPKGMEIANHRQVSLVSTEELSDIAQAMGLPGPVPHGCLGENLVLSGIPNLTRLPSGTLIFFRKNEKQPRTAAIAVWKENGPCLAPGEAIQIAYPTVSKLAPKFPKAAMGRRGLVGSVYVSGFVEEGDEVIVKIPKQRTY